MSKTRCFITIPFHLCFQIHHYKGAGKPSGIGIKWDKTIILPVGLHGCEIWSLTMSEEYRLRVTENKVPKRIFGCRKDVTGSWRDLHNEELHNLYSSPSIITMIKSRIRMAGYVAQKRKNSNAHRMSVGKPEGKRPLGRPRCRWVNNIKISVVG
jgi:hypothetical protein